MKQNQLLSLQHSQARENQEPCTRLGKHIWEHLMVDLLKHNSLLKEWSWSALKSGHYWPALTEPSLDFSFPLQPLLNSLLHTYWCFCRLSSAFLQAAGARKSAEGTLRGRTPSGEFVAQFPPLPSALSSIYPLFMLLWLSFPPHAAILVLNFDETKPGVAHGIYLFRSKY